MSFKLEKKGGTTTLVKGEGENMIAKLKRSVYRVRNEGACAYLCQNACKTHMSPVVVSSPTQHPYPFFPRVSNPPPPSLPVHLSQKAAQLKEKQIIPENSG